MKMFTLFTIGSTEFMQMLILFGTYTKLEVVHHENFTQVQSF